MAACGTTLPVDMVVLWLILACVFGAHGSEANLSDDPLLDVRTVASSSALQQAVSDGVRHIILTEHVDAGRPQTTAQTTGAIAYMQAIQVKPSTRSIVVCSADHMPAGCPSTCAGVSRGRSRDTPRDTPRDTVRRAFRESALTLLRCNLVAYELFVSLCCCR